MFHADHAAICGAPAVILRTPDTDVVAISISASHDIPTINVIFRTGTKQRTCYVNLTEKGCKLGEDVSDALVGYHSFTGTD